MLLAPARTPNFSWTTLTLGGEHEPSIYCLNTLLVQPTALPLEALDIILCRNVMIYFDEAEQKRLIEKFWHCLNPGGYLFVGHAESLFGLTQKFRMVHLNNGTAYQRVEANS